MTAETRERFRELLQDRDGWDFSTPGTARHPEGATIRPDYSGRDGMRFHITCNGETTGAKGEGATADIQALFHHFARECYKLPYPESIKVQAAFYRGIPAGCPRPPSRWGSH